MRILFGAHYSKLHSVNLPFCDKYWISALTEPPHHNLTMSLWHISLQTRQLHPHYHPHQHYYHQHPRYHLSYGPRLTIVDASRAPA